MAKKKGAAAAVHHETEEQAPDSGETVTEPLDLDEAKAALGEASNEVDEAERLLSDAKAKFSDASHVIGAWLAGKGKHAVIEIDGKQWASKLAKRPKSEEGAEAPPQRYTLVRHYARNVVG